MSYLGNPRIAMMRQDRMPVANYEVAGNPTVDVNPAFVPCSWLNVLTGEIFVCTDNTTGANIWKGQLGTSVPV
jgi:hypothetical protein